MRVYRKYTHRIYKIKHKQKNSKIFCFFFSKINMYKTGKKYVHIVINLITHAARYCPVYKQNVHIKALYLMNVIKALTFYLTGHQDFGSILVFVCMCIIILWLKFTKSKLNPTWLTQTTLLIYWLRKQAFPIVVLP